MQWQGQGLLRHEGPHAELGFRHDVEGDCSVCELICVGSQIGFTAQREDPPLLRASGERTPTALRLEHENPPLLLR